MQPRRRPHHGNLPAARPRRKGAQCRIAGGLSARHQLSHLVHRAGTDADSRFPAAAIVSRRTTARTATGRRRSRRIASTRSFSNRSCSSMPPRSRASASSTGPRSKTSWSRMICARVSLRDLDTGAVRRVSCRYLIGCDGARSIVRKAIGAELSGDAIVQRVQSTYIRAPGLIDRQQQRTRLGHRRDQSAPLRHGVCDRRPRALAGAQLHEARRDRFRCGRSRRLPPHHPRRRRRLPIRHHLQGGLVRPPADRRQISRPLRLHRRRCRAYLGALCRLRHERRHCRRDEPVVAAGGASQRLGAGCHSRRL